MEKRLLNHSELIVDTSFLLPFVGIKVKGIDERLLEGKRIYYPSLMLTELIAVIMKEVRKLKLKKIPEEAIKGLFYINSTVNFITLEDLNLVYEIISEGWNDIFDAILYSSYASTKIPLITLDKMFYDFLNKKGFNVSEIILL
ncbi:PIN domain-containing protein [Sulfolobus sp. A20]|uniref:PIN domain-containing protein n=1 Tax=Sulfolobaceae TaxID=118883 RepID=UPI0008462413|nr:MULTISPECIES: PIN domain-containing protein [unclassified Sulfolobus]TRM75848.1 PIN domain-containing protein [Sulfolobus sp. A20-N-F8]TRM79016.1 PIN domain-containing protein [Sulfolobus sp. B5]TRM83591.1 PIN domain-containing protein [Sulfolobus sp. A20-N-F6]TRM84619.1 PIN domain-containing protein [Sulfolobus sp. E3]TRM84918.1 PIN domain-containing protein [Sulfolobus sp. F3]TRM88326.1 PIN domain-containing protein [Sulfolobus sp. C3]TRM95298.1 PIN domain-containing protein [Sulfolobus